jgi:aldehyde dehydrogenase (NAD+)
LAGGNVCCLKPSEITENTSKLIAELFPKYFSSEIITVVEGSVKETTDLLDQRWDKIFFTGIY